MPPVRIYPFTHLYADLRDWGLFELLVRSLERLNDTRVAPLTAFHDPASAFSDDALSFCGAHGVHLVARSPGYDCWGESCAIQVASWRHVASDEAVHPSDFVVSLDSDVLFLSSALFDELGVQDFVGFAHSQKTFVPALGRAWAHTSGCFQAARAGKVREVVAFSADDVRRALAQLSACSLPLIHDLVTSYLFALCGAATHELSVAAFMEDNIAGVFAGRSPPRPFIHLVGDWRAFLGEPVANKWDLARPLRARFPPPGVAPQPTLDELYAERLTTDSDIFQHLPTLRSYAARCDHVTEFGVRYGVSTFALLHAQPKRLVSYDIRPFALEKTVERVAGRTAFSFCQADVRDVTIEETDLLFIDTLHSYAQISRELELHAPRVRRFIILHDTTTFGHTDEGQPGPGLWPGVEAFLAGGTFSLREKFEHNNGLTVLERS